MKILMFGWEFPPFISGGLGTACDGLTRGLAGKGVDIDFVVPRMPGSQEYGHVRLVTAFSRGFDESETEDLLAHRRIHAVDTFLTPYLTETSYREILTGTIESLKGTGAGEAVETPYGPDLFSEVMRLKVIAGSIASDSACDVIHVHDWMTIPAGMAARDARGRPLVVHIHSLESDRSALRLNERIYAIERLGMMEADHVIAVSHYTERKIIEQYGIPPGKITVVHNAVSREEAPASRRVKKDKSKKYVLFLGRITSQKGPEYFLKAARLVYERDPSVHFVIAGTGDLVHAMEEETVRLGMENHVHFAGFVSGNDVEKTYVMSDLYVMPSVSEPFGIAALEALTYDVPVIVSSQSGVREVIGCCPRVDYWDIEKMATVMLEILGDENRRKEIVSACQDEMKDLTWKIAADKIVGIYDTLAGES